MRAAAYAAALSFILCHGVAAQAGVIPAPLKVVAGDGEFAVDANTIIQVPNADPDAAAAAHYLGELWQHTNLLPLSIQAGSPRGAATAPRIRFERVPGLKAEGYRLSVAARDIRIQATSAAGLFYGAVTLWQLLPAQQQGGRIAAQFIEDSPRFAWRGLLLDSSRHVQSPAFIRSMIDWMAWHKLNVLHWHLTDDQGWRIEIHKYPQLTRIGAWRDGGAYGGFYSQEQIRDIVAFAAARHITVVPEIDMPGHATAAIAAYPQFGAAAGPLSVSSNWGVHDHLFNVEPATFGFLEDVLTEVMALFPSHYIHVGGDEAVKTEWRASQQVQARARALRITDPDVLQMYFTQRIGRFLNAHGRRLVGWDEILGPGLSRSAVVMSWRGVEGAHAAAVAGNDTILSPQPVLYFDHRQSSLPNEPPGRLLPSTLEQVYRFDPLDPRLDAAQLQHVLGVQANIWTEHIRTEARVVWMALPRAAAVAEVGWSAQRDWPGFLTRLSEMFDRYRAYDLGYADSVFGIGAQISRNDATDVPPVTVRLSNSAELRDAGLGTLRYRLDGRDPDQHSSEYTVPLQLAFGTEMHAATFIGSRRVSRPLIERIDATSGLRHDSHDLDRCTEGVGLLLEPRSADANRTIAIDIMNPCWLQRDVDLSHDLQLLAAVAPLPFNYELGAEAAKIRVGDARTRYGELQVHVDDCAGPAVLSLPLPDPAGASAADGVFTLPMQRLPRLPGRHDLCLRFARPALNPMWGLDWVEVSGGVTGDG